MNFIVKLAPVIIGVSMLNLAASNDKLTPDLIWGAGLLGFMAGSAQIVFLQSED